MEPLNGAGRSYELDIHETFSTIADVPLTQFNTVYSSPIAINQTSSRSQNDGLSSASPMSCDSITSLSSLDSEPTRATSAANSVSPFKQGLSFITPRYTNQSAELRASKKLTYFQEAFPKCSKSKIDKMNESSYKWRSLWGPTAHRHCLEKYPNYESAVSGEKSTDGCLVAGADQSTCRKDQGPTGRELNFLIPATY